MPDRRIYPDDCAERLKARAGQPYRPSNGTEGEIFEAAWCDGCRRDATFRGWWERNGAADEQPEGCAILCNAHAFDIGQDGYPAEWVYGTDGQPACRAFEDKDEAPRCPVTADLFSGEASHA